MLLNNFPEFSLKPFQGIDDDYRLQLELLTGLMETRWKHWDTVESLRYDSMVLPKHSEESLEFIYYRGQPIGWGMTRFHPYAYTPTQMDSLLMLPHDPKWVEFGKAYVSEQIKSITARKATSMRAWQFHDTPWAQKVFSELGFTVSIKEVGTELDLSSYQRPSSLRLDNGIKLTTMEALLSQADTAQAKVIWQKFYRLWVQIEHDVPQDSLGDPDFSYEDWYAAVMHPWQRLSDMYVALQADNMVGLCVYARPMGADASARAHTELTGVIPSHRQQGIATNLKDCSIQALKAQGLQSIHTENEENNPMLQINFALGFKIVGYETGRQLKLS